MVSMDRILVLNSGAVVVHAIQAISVIHHATMSGITVRDLCAQAASLGTMPSELLTEAWLRLAASRREG